MNLDKINYLKYKIKYINLKNNINNDIYVKNRLILMKKKNIIDIIKILNIYPGDPSPIEYFIGKIIYSNESNRINMEKNVLFNNKNIIF
tara:strand:+ start:996 stop:1262 length:267 start_codon:yes stop_codon:yes gene_type:complete